MVDWDFIKPGGPLDKYASLLAGRSSRKAVETTISSEALQMYLLAYGWEEISSEYPNLARFSLTLDGQEWQIRVPRSRKQPDLYESGIADAIRIIAELHNEDPDAIKATLRKMSERSTALGSR